jgi:molecular chaperone DnaK (HSP70)
MATFGIDLGTTYSCIARIDDSGRASVIKNALGEDLTPSVVYFESQDSVVVGRDAKSVAKLYPDLVVSLIKRQMGTDYEQTFHGETHTPETISALILRELARAAAQETGETVRDVVITCPAYFGLAQKEATRKAGEIAGLNVLNIVPEPVAAALHYEATGTGEDRTILVFDLGGGTFDTTVIKLVGNDIRVVCTDGDHKLGGADWDEAIASFLLNQFLEENPGSDAAGNEEFMQDLTIRAEEMKKALSSVQSRKHSMRFGAETCRAELTRAEFENLASTLLGRAMDITQRTIEKAREFGINSFDDVLLVGGSTRVPAVAARLREQFGFEPRLHDPDQAVAKGAALFALIESVKVLLPGEAGEEAQASISDTKVEEVARHLGITADKVRQLATKSVTSVVSRAFGVKVVDRKAHEALPDDDEKLSFKIVHILEANRPLPASPDTQQFYTVYPDQVAVSIEIWEQAGAVASSDPADNNKIGDGLITGLPPLPQESPIDVTFRMNETGLLRVEAVELKTGAKLKMELQTEGLAEAKLDEARSAIARYATSE